MSFFISSRYFLGIPSSETISILLYGFIAREIFLLDIGLSKISTS